MNKLKILILILAIIFFAGSIYLTWYLASQRQSNADVAQTTASTVPTTEQTTSGTSGSTTVSTDGSISQKVSLILQPGYNLKTIPYILSPNDGKTIFLNLISRKASALENGEWKDLLTDSRAVTPAQGIIVESQNGEVYTLPGTATELDQKKPFNISIKTGWNAIGNPFTHDIKWNPVIKTSQGSTSLKKALEANILTAAFSYNAASKEYEEMKENDTWRTFQGLLIKSGGDLDLIIDPTLVP